ncbi:MAG: DUF411 domain-containing protein [Alphaproteobacteria bacterium]|nr:DUF411 domain-containing protein [Alphaproteobacteria bacterium]
MHTRRKILTCMALLPAISALPALAQLRTAIHVYKGRGCACCTAWVDILKREGFAPTTEVLHPADLVQLKLSKSVPLKLSACHTAVIDGYLVEGHVPAADIRRLISDKPDALGIAVPEMPYGSPGMGPESEREAYDVILFKADKTTEIFSRYEAAS